LLSPADLLVAFVAGLLFFGPEGLPQAARKVGRVVRELQNTSQAFVQEMERAADTAPAEKGESLPPQPPEHTSESRELPGGAPRDGK
jgi:Sec-independent protein translocase protein TatA